MTDANVYEDWRGYFNKRLTASGAFSLSHTSSKGNTETEIYTALKGNADTTIQIGYFSSSTIIYLNILNPYTPGTNRQQENEHLYKYEFDEVKQYGTPGLEFNETNLRGIDNLLDNGFTGQEKVFYLHGKPIKSIVTCSLYPDTPTATMTYYFGKESFYQRLLNKLTGRSMQYDDTRLVDLRDVFGGLNKF